ncbi:uncharacterized protein LOC113488367 [Athene cunicularia]|uniref:uncharacterized protein LOC113488367 n=1 Tax=Athene cunicularia TaxID=194338 RepID=UPI000EF74EE4|nr:uncharacterized protein LOC113488367 [Athene cunicularia]
MEDHSESSSLLEPDTVSMVQPLQIGSLAKMAVGLPTLPWFRVDETLLEENLEESGCDPEGTWLQSSLRSSILTMAFGEDLQPPQKTEILLVAIEALTADDVHDRQMGIGIVDIAMKYHVSWLRDVPKVLRGIHKIVEHIHAELARHSLDLLLLLLLRWRPREVVRTLLDISPTCDSAAVALWEVLISGRWALWRVLSEMLSVLQDCRLRRVFSCAAEDSCIYPLAVSDHALPQSSAFVLLLLLPDACATCSGPPDAGLAPPSLSRHRQHSAFHPACIPLPGSGPGTETWGL